MPADPESAWDYGPVSDFEFPASSRLDLLREFLIVRYRRALSSAELEFVTRLIDEFLSWSENNTGRNELRFCASKLVKLLDSIDEWMTQARDKEVAWEEVAWALDLSSACTSHLSLSEISRRSGLTKRGESARAHRFLEIVGFAAAFDSGNGRCLSFY
jgi:hypothetical protein